MCWLNFFDDYPVVTPKLLGPSTKQTLKALVDLLGFDRVWEKMNDFPPCATMLGVEVDLGEVGSVGVENRNKEGLARLLPLQGTFCVKAAFLHVSCSM